MEGKDFCIYEFDEFQLDARRRALSKNSEKVPLSARNFDLLLFMVENGGRILEHDELLDKVWAGTFVEQATLKKGISALRRILDEKPENEFIKTIPRRGYSFVSPVRVVHEPDETFYVRETEREIIIEEFEETADEKAVKALPAAKTNYAKFALFGFAALAVFALAFFGLKSYFSKPVSPQFSIENVRITRITNDGKVISGTAVSADGNYILYPTVEPNGVVLWLRQIQGNSARKLTVPTSGSFWAFGIAPDNSYIYYVFNNNTEPQKSGLFKLSFLGGDEPQRIAENVSSLAISPDGNRLAIVRLGEKTVISTINPKGEDEREIKSFDGDFRLWSFVWTPDGKNLLCSIRKTVENKGLFYIAEISAENGAESIILPLQEKNIFSAAWLPDRSALILTVREANADIRQIWQYFPASKDWRRVTNDNNSYKFANLTRDGKIIVTNQESRLAAIWLADGVKIERKTPETKSLLNNSDNFRQITSGVSSFDRIGWLADGRLMYSATEDGRETIFTINRDGTNARQITSGEDGLWIFPNVSGNGQNISFLSAKTGARQVWRIDSDGKNAAKLTESNFPVSAARILRDNATIVYYFGANSECRASKQTPDGKITQLTATDTNLFAISPDETLFAAEVFDETQRKYQIELRSLEDGKTIKAFDFRPIRQLSFTPDGKTLAYIALSGGTSQIMIQPLDGAESFALTDFQTDEIFSFGWSADATQIAIVRGKQLNDAVLIKSNSR